MREGGQGAVALEFIHFHGSRGVVLPFAHEVGPVVGSQQTGNGKDDASQNEQPEVGAQRIRSRQRTGVGRHKAVHGVE